MKMHNEKKIAIWFPTVKCGTGTDIFTINLVEELNKRGIRAEITWLPLRAEYLPWTVPIPKPPEWATIAHINTWLHKRFLPPNLPIIATLHHSIHDPNLKKYKGWLRAIYHQYWIAPNERYIMQEVQQVTAVSQFVADMAKRTLCDVSIQVIYNGVNTELFIPSNKIRQKNEPFRLLFIGSWMARKGVDLLAPIMRELGDDFELHYTGGNAAKKDKMNMPKNMHDIGRLNQQEVIQAMQNADALLFPSRSEGFGLVVIEAMACGLPIIAIENTVISELITHKKNGFLCEQDNVYHISHYIRKLSSNQIIYTQMANFGVTTSSKFTNKIMIENYFKLYQKYLNC